MTNSRISTDEDSVLESFDRRKALSGLGGAAILSIAGCLDGGSSPEGDAPDSLGQPTLGAADSDIPVLQLFEDWGCPHCLRFEQNVMPQLIEDYVDEERLYIEYYDFPLPVRSLSKEAAVSGRVVQHLGGNEAFWNYKDAVMPEQENFSFDLFREQVNALDADVNGDEVVKQTKSGAWGTFVEEDKQYGSNNGITGTPGLILEGTKIEPGSYEAVANQIEQILAQQ